MYNYNRLFKKGGYHNLTGQEIKGSVTVLASPPFVLIVATCCRNHAITIIEVFIIFFLPLQSFILLLIAPSDLYAQSPILIIGLAGSVIALNVNAVLPLITPVPDAWPVS